MFARPIPTIRLALSRSFANQLPRPPPKPLPPPETFSSTSRPRQYYSRPHPRDLPPYRVSHCSWACIMYGAKPKPTHFIGWLQICSAHGPASSRSASVASPRGPHSCHTPLIKSVRRAPRCAVCSASCVRAKTCVPSSETRCVQSPCGISAAVRGCTARCVCGAPRVHPIQAPERGKVIDYSDPRACRSRCCKGTSISASGSKVTRVRPLETFTHPLSCFADPIRLPWEGAGTVYFTSIRRARGEPFTTCAYQISLRLLSPSLYAPILRPGQSFPF